MHVIHVLGLFLELVDNITVKGTKKNPLLIVYQFKALQQGITFPAPRRSLNNKVSHSVPNKLKNIFLVFAMSKLNLFLFWHFKKCYVKPTLQIYQKKLKKKRKVKKKCG